jgi:hypothetical protein
MQTALRKLKAVFCFGITFVFNKLLTTAIYFYKNQIGLTDLLNK